MRQAVNTLGMHRCNVDKYNQQLCTSTISSTSNTCFCLYRVSVTANDPKIVEWRAAAADAAAKHARDASSDATTAAAAAVTASTNAATDAAAAAAGDDAAAQVVTAAAAQAAAAAVAPAAARAAAANAASEAATGAATEAHRVADELAEADAAAAADAATAEYPAAAAAAIASLAAARDAMAASAVAAADVAAAQANLATAAAAMFGHDGAAAGAPFAESIAAFQAATAVSTAALVRAASTAAAALAAMTAAKDTAAVALVAAGAADAAAAAAQAIADGDDVENPLDMAWAMRYNPFAAVHSDAGGQKSRKLLSTAQRQSECVQSIGAWSRGLIEEAHLCQLEEMLRRFCTQRTEVGVRIRNVANIQELLAKLKAAIAQLFRKMFSRPLDLVTDNADRQLSLFQWKCSFWSKLLTLTQQASAAGLAPEDKQTAMKFICAQLQLLLCGRSRLLDESKVSRIASQNRLCCFIPPNVLPEPLLVYLREQQ
jgi:hypothetical protein